MRVLKHVLEHNKEYSFFRKNSHIIAVPITNYVESESENQNVTTASEIMQTFQYELSSNHLFSVFGIHILSGDKACLEHNSNLKLMFNEAGVSTEIENLTSLSGGRSFSICASQFNQLAHLVYEASLMVSKNLADIQALGKE